jgi:signal transduction histidine kinase
MPSKFTVFFENPFWVGVLEIAEPDGVRAARHVFGPEPTGPELEEFVRRDFLGLLDRAMSSPPVPADSPKVRRRINPKRSARLAAREQAAPSVSTAAQEALAMSFELRKMENRAAGKRRRAAEADERRRIARDKARARHRGH